MGNLGRDIEQRLLAFAAAGICAAYFPQRKRPLSAHGHRLWLCTGEEVVMSRTLLDARFGIADWLYST